MEKKIVLELKKDKETKGAIRYRDKKHSLYLRKDEISTPYPEEMKLTIEFK